MLGLRGSCRSLTPPQAPAQAQARAQPKLQPVPTPTKELHLLAVDRFASSPYSATTSPSVVLLVHSSSRQPPLPYQRLTSSPAAPRPLVLTTTPRAIGAAAASRAFPSPPWSANGFKGRGSILSNQTPSVILIAIVITPPSLELLCHHSNQHGGSHARLATTPA